MSHGVFTRIAIISSSLTLAGCANSQHYTQSQEEFASVYSIDAIKDDPNGFLAKHRDERIIVEGYFVVDRITDGLRAPLSNQVFCDFDAISGDSEKHVHLDLPLNKANFRSAVLHWIVVEATVKPPRNLQLGGGDLTVMVDATDVHVILEDGKLLAVSAGREPCQRGSGPAQQ